MWSIASIAPTNNSDNQCKEEFYRKLLTIIQDHSEQNVIIVMEHFNAKIGRRMEVPKDTQNDFDVTADSESG